MAFIEIDELTKRSDYPLKERLRNLGFRPYQRIPQLINVDHIVRIVPALENEKIEGCRAYVHVVDGKKSHMIPTPHSFKALKELIDPENKLRDVRFMGDRPRSLFGSREVV